MTEHHHFQQGFLPTVQQGWATLVLEGSIPNQTHLKILTCIFRVSLKITGRSVWLGMELNIAEQWPSRTKIAHPWPTRILFRAGLCWIVVKTVEQFLRVRVVWSKCLAQGHKVWTIQGFELKTFKLWKLLRDLLQWRSAGGIAYGPSWDLNLQPSVLKNC